jgi:prolyl-tRNA synthetase
VVELFKRESGEKEIMKVEDVLINLDKIIFKTQNNLLKKNKEFRENNTYYVDTYEEFKEKIEKGFVMAHWDGTAETAEKIQNETKATIRCIPNEEFLKNPKESGRCIISANESK